MYVSMFVRAWVGVGEWWWRGWWIGWGD